MNRKRQTSVRDGVQALLNRLEAVFEQERDKSVKPLYPIVENGKEIKLPQDVEKRLHQMAKTRKAPQAVKEVAYLTGAGLRVAKDYVDRLAKQP